LSHLSTSSFLKTSSSVFFVLVAWLDPVSAHADERVPVALEYVAPPGCPDAEGFLAEIAARTSLPRLAEPGERATALDVVVSSIEGGYKGSLAIETATGAAAARNVSAASCEQVVSALALMTALALDPNASTAAVKKEPTPAPEPEPAPAKPTPVTASPAPSTVRKRRWRLQLGGAFEVLAGVVPSAFFLGRPSVELGNAGQGRWSMAFRLGAGFGSRTITGRSGAAEFSLVSGRLEGCPRLRASKDVDISVCAALDAGRLEGAGVGVTPAERVERPWVAPGAVLRLEYEITHLLELEAAGEGFVPLVRDRFFIGSGETLGRAAAIVGGATVGLGVRYP